jgi:electron transfer flavoprotein alpha subunit
MTASLYSPAAARKEIWVYLEQEEGALLHISLELLSKGRELADANGWRLVGLLLGAKVAHLVDQAFAHGADAVVLGEHSLLRHFTIDAYAQAAFQALMSGKPGVFLLGATHNGRDLAARLAVRLRTGLNADCTNLQLEPPEGLLISEVSGFGGGVLALIGMPQHRPQMATVRAGVFNVSEETPGRKGEVLTFPVVLDESKLRTRILERNVAEGVDISQTPLLVAAGRGMGTDLAELRQLASRLGGELGVTRPLVDMGLVERERQVGQTGVVCSPKLALCCGISGAFHFVVGIEKAGTVIAINTDPDAAIFESADYCVVADARLIIFELNKALAAVGEAEHD